MTTGLHLVTNAMREIGAIGMGDTPEPENADYALGSMNRMLDAWPLSSLFAYHTAWQQFNITSSQQTRTIGPGGDVNTTRPIRVEVGSYTVQSGISRELLIASRDKWSTIDVKTVGAGQPGWVYYEAGSPLGTLYFWPQCDCQVNLALQVPISTFAAVTTNVTLLPGYEEAITLSLAERLCRPFTRPMPETLPREAALARRNIKLSNFQVPELDLPRGRAEIGGFSGFLSGV